jgi:hypothetical protein
MAWEWSHTEEAYDYAREQLGKRPRKELMEIGKEWKSKLHIRLALTPMSDDCLADWIWEQASGYGAGRTCSNGGGELWMCPEGCHTVDLDDMPDGWTPEDF